MANKTSNPERFLHLTSESRAAKCFSVVNPSTGDLLAEVPDMAPEDVSKAIDKADAAQEHSATLLQTAKMNNVDPLAWLTQTLERIAN
ncbi:aldehyde dehydrogenase family protein [Rhizobium mongolense]|uniref:aldehyde dehydrogenase family protein n=1 Tax=Rhizobium mongolense TaxID=57676 RepID=UPI003F629D0D